MRKNFIILLFLFSLNYSISYSQTATDFTRDFQIGYGFISDVEIIAALANLDQAIFSGFTGEPESSTYNMTGPFISGYKFYLSKKFVAGPEINYIQLDMTNKYTSGEEIDYHFYITNLSGRLDYKYEDKENICLYSGLSLGGSYIYCKSTDINSNNKSAIFFSYQIDFFGIRIGKAWGGYAEFGFGRNGLLNIGVSGRF